MKHWDINLGFFLPFFRTPIVSKVLVPTMRKPRLVRCLDWTPIPLCSSAYLYCICKQSIHITTIEAVNFLNDIEIIEKSTLIDKVLRALHTRYSIEWKCCPLIDRDTYIKNNSRNKHSINKWNWEEMSQICWHHIPPSWESELLISLAKLLKKYDPLFCERKTVFLSESIIFLTKLRIERLDLWENILDSWFHRKY